MRIFKSVIFLAASTLSIWGAFHIYSNYALYFLFIPDSIVISNGINYFDHQYISLKCDSGKLSLTVIGKNKFPYGTNQGSITETSEKIGIDATLTAISQIETPQKSFKSIQLSVSSANFERNVVMTVAPLTAAQLRELVAMYEPTSPDRLSFDFLETATAFKGSANAFAIRTFSATCVSNNTAEQ